MSFHTRAQIAAEAAQCAHAQGKFWEYHDLLFANQGALGDEELRVHAADLELDASEFDSCLSNGRFRNDVTNDLADGGRFGVPGTPAFFVNGRFLKGHQPFEAFAKLIDEELEGNGFEITP